jgi:hypothetical protein
MHGIDGRTTLPRMKEILREAGITFSERINPAGIEELVTEGNVTLGFTTYEFDESVIQIGDEYLCAISRYDYHVLRRTQPTKQVAVTIPESTYEVIRQEALRQHISIAKLCSQWVIESAGKDESDG